MGTTLSTMVFNNDTALSNELREFPGLDLRLLRMVNRSRTHSTYVVMTANRYLKILRRVPRIADRSVPPAAVANVPSISLGSILLGKDLVEQYYRKGEDYGLKLICKASKLFLHPVVSNQLIPFDEVLISEHSIMLLRPKYGLQLSELLRQPTIYSFTPAVKIWWLFQILVGLVQLENLGFVHDNLTLSACILHKNKSKLSLTNLASSFIQIPYISKQQAALAFDSFFVDSDITYPAAVAGGGSGSMAACGVGSNLEPVIWPLNKSCTLPPERFTDKPPKSFDLNPKSHIFSAGCVVAAIFLLSPSAVVFELEEVLELCSPCVEELPLRVLALLDEIPSSAVREMLVRHMLCGDPEKRTVPMELLDMYRGSLFSERIYSFHYPLMMLTDLPGYSCPSIKAWIVSNSVNFLLFELQQQPLDYLPEFLDWESVISNEVSYLSDQNETPAIVGRVQSLNGVIGQGSVRVKSSTGFWCLLRQIYQDVAARKDSDDDLAKTVDPSTSALWESIIVIEEVRPDFRVVSMDDFLHNCAVHQEPIEDLDISALILLDALDSCAKNGAYKYGMYTLQRTLPFLSTSILTQEVGPWTAIEAAQCPERLLTSLSVALALSVRKDDGARSFALNMLVR